MKSENPLLIRSEADQLQLRRTIGAMENELNQLNIRDCIKSALIDENRALMLGLDVSGKITRVDSISARLLRVDPDILIGTALQQLIHSDDVAVFDQGLTDLLAAGNGARRVLILRLNRAWGTGPTVQEAISDENIGDIAQAEVDWRTCEVTISNRFTERYIAGIILIGHDVTPWAEAATHLHVAQREAARAARAKADLLAIMSHEIRTPLNGVIGTLRLLAGMEMETEQAGYAQIALESGEMLLALLNDILDLSKAEAGQMRLERHPFDLEKVIEDMLRLLVGRAQQRGIRLEVQISPEIPSFIEADAGGCGKYY